MFQDGKGGLINYILMNLHLTGSPVSWLQNTWTANLVIWILGIWKSIGWVMVIYLASLQGIPKDLYSAADIDGASSLKKFWKITVPLVRPTTYYIFISLVLGAFNIFYAVYMITGGGPLGSTDVLQNYMYTQAFKYFHFGYACAISIITGLSIFILTLFRFKLFKYERK
jgi:multiple sugar transport system permease protein